MGGARRCTVRVHTAALPRPNPHALNHSVGSVVHSALLERLWPFFRHPVVAVRLAVLRILPELAHVGAVPMASDAALAAELLAQLFQTFLLEEQSVRSANRPPLGPVPDLDR